MSDQPRPLLGEEIRSRFVAWIAWLAAEHGVGLDLAGFARLMAEQQERSRAQSHQAGAY